MEAMRNMIVGAVSSSATSAGGAFDPSTLQVSSPKPTITPEKIGCVMADVQTQIDGLQLYLIELGLAKRAGGMGITILRETTGAEWM